MPPPGLGELGRQLLPTFMGPIADSVGQLQQMCLFEKQGAQDGIPVSVLVGGGLT